MDKKRLKGQLLQELLGVQLSAVCIATFVNTCHQQLAGVETGK